MEKWKNSIFFNLPCWGATAGGARHQTKRNETKRNETAGSMTPQTPKGAEFFSFQNKKRMADGILLFVRSCGSVWLRSSA
jgi:hypothetical protein